MRTYTKCTRNSFRIRTYENTGGGGLVEIYESAEQLSPLRVLGLGLCSLIPKALGVLAGAIQPAAGLGPQSLFRIPLTLRPSSDDSSVREYP